MQLQLGIMHVFMYVQLSIMVLWDLPNMHVNWLKEEDEEHPNSIRFIRAQLQWHLSMTT